MVLGYAENFEVKKNNFFSSYECFLFWLLDFYIETKRTFPLQGYKEFPHVFFKGFYSFVVYIFALDPLGV